MFEERDAKAPKQGEFWVARDHLPAGGAGTSYRRLDQTLRKIGFAEALREVCRPAYREAGAGGSPGIDPAVYFKMLMIGFFENLPSERAIASRCEDSLCLRAFLADDLTEGTPDHSALSVIRTRMGGDVFQAVLEIVLKALLDHKLLKGRHLGLDSSIIEANASLRELQHRNTREDYWSYVKKLATGAGSDPDDTKTVLRFDKKHERRKTSNEDWFHPQDPEAKVVRAKDGACDMVYKPEHLTDLDTGAIIRAEVRAGDAGDSEFLCERVIKGCETLARVCEDPKQENVAETVTTEEGCFSLEEICGVQCEGIRTIMSDPHASNRQEAKLCKVGRQTLRKARVAVQSTSGKALLRKRGEHLERSFAHGLDQGGMRRATLRGTENLTKRLTAAALAYNLSLLMRKLFGFGTPKQWTAKATFWVFGLMKTVLGATRGLAWAIGANFARTVEECRNPRNVYQVSRSNGPSGCFSTGYYARSPGEMKKEENNGACPFCFDVLKISISLKF
jgi:transposase